MSESVTDLQDRLKAQGYKLTKPRRAVLDVLHSVASHMTPEQVYEQARRKHKKLSLVTVYRTLALLHQLGLVQRVHLNDGCHSFARTDSTKGEGHHHQVICQDCGRVEELADCALPLQKISAETGFQISQHRVEVMGRCPDCQNQ